MHMKGVSGCHQRIMHDPRAQHPGQMFLPGSGFLRGRKTGVPREKPPSQVEINRGSAHMIAEVGGTNVEHNANLTFKISKSGSHYP